MRCISPSRNYSIQVIEGDERIVIDQGGTARQMTLSKPVIANFEGSGLLDHEIEPALTSFNFSGLPEGVNPLARLSVFDTEAYVESRSEFEEDEKGKQAFLEKIDARLRKLASRFPNEFIIVEKPASARPWATFDSDSVEDILLIQARIQYSPEAIRLYEVENQNRTELVEAMLAIEEAPATEEDVVLSA